MHFVQQETNTHTVQQNITDILKNILDRDVSEKYTWEALVSYRDKELRMREHMLLVNTCQSTRFEASE